MGQGTRRQSRVPWLPAPARPDPGPPHAPGVARPQDEKNAAWVCRSCNASKGARGLYEYYTTAEGDLKAAACDTPRLADGMYVKLLHGLFDDAGVHGITEDDLHARFCPECDIGPICAKERSVGKVSPVRLDGAATAVLRNSG